MKSFKENLGNTYRLWLVLQNNEKIIGSANQKAIRIKLRKNL